MYVVGPIWFFAAALPYALTKAQLSANDTIEVCTTRGWESANVISVNEGEDRCGLAMWTPD